MGVQLRVLFTARFVSEGGRNDVAGSYLFSNAGAASDSRLCVAIFQDVERSFNGFVMGLNDTLIFLDEGGNADTLRSAKSVVGGGAMFGWIDAF